MRTDRKGEEYLLRYSSNKRTYWKSKNVLESEVVEIRDSVKNKRADFEKDKTTYWFPNKLEPIALLKMKVLGKLPHRKTSK